MSTDYSYIIKGSRGSYNTEINGFEFKVFVTLTGVISTGDWPPSEDDVDIKQLYNALTDSAIPFAGTDLFDATGITDLDGCWLRRIDATALGDGQFDLTLTYQQSQWGIIQIDAGSNLSQVETTKYLSGVDVGDNIELTYTYPSDYGGDEPSEEQIRLVDTGELKQGGTVNVLLPERSRIYTVRQPNDPTTEAALYVGTVNDSLWWSGAARTWLCASIQGTSDNSGVLVSTPTEWVNRYEFQYKSDGWDPEVIYSDDITGNPVPDAVDGTSLKTIPSYDTTDFTEMFAGS